MIGYSSYQQLHVLAKMVAITRLYVLKQINWYNTQFQSACVRSRTSWLNSYKVIEIACCVSLSAYYVQPDDDRNM